MILIGCRGGSPDAPEILKAVGWKYGSRSDGTIYAKPHFIDINWKNYKWLKHWLVVRKWRPNMAMVADYLRPEQKTTMLRQVRHIRALGVRPMCCPKFTGATLDIPADCIVAISVPTPYGGFLPEPSEVAGRELHLLGGHPDQIVVEMRRYHKSKIVSLDCSVMFMKAQFGAYWEPRVNDWLYVKKNSIETHQLIKMSAENIANYIANPPKYVKFNKRTIAAKYDVQCSFL